jgi:hypothetical protein
MVEVDITDKDCDGTGLCPHILMQAIDAMLSMIREQAYYSAGNFIKIGSYDDSPRENVLSLPPEDERVERLAAAYMAAFYEMAGSIIRRCIDGLIHETTLPTQLQVIDHNISNLIEIAGSLSQLTAHNYYRPGEIDPLETSRGDAGVSIGYSYVGTKWRPNQASGAYPFIAAMTA